MQTTDRFPRFRRPALCAFAMAAALAAAPLQTWAADPPAATGGHPNIQTADAGFMQLAAGNGVYEVEVSRLAVQKARRADVKAYAQMLVADHTQANEALKRLAASKRIKLATDIPKDKQSVIDHLAGSDSFDKDFIQQVGLSDHKNDIGLFEKQASNGTDPDINAWAAATVPKLRAHLAQAEKLAAGQGGATPHHGK